MSSRKGDAIQAIKARIRLADVARRYVEVRPVGSRLVAPCPFHQETKPSLSINDEQGTFYCFGCQASGDLFDFYGRINGLDFRETLEQLADEAGIRLEDSQPDPRAAQNRSQKRDMLKMHEIAGLHFVRTLQKSSSPVCRDYLHERALKPAVLEQFGIGFSGTEWQDLQQALQRAGYTDSAATTVAVNCGLLSRNDAGRVYDRFRNRLMFPIRNLSGQVIAFGGRILPALIQEGRDEAKYINSSDSPIYKKGEHLYGLFQARPAITTQKKALLTEGYMDVLTLHQYGYTNAVGVLGTALTPEQVKRLSGFCSHVELLFDGDKAGRKAALRSCEMLLLRGLSCKVVLFPEGEDIDSLLRTEGTEAFEALRRAAPEGLDFCVHSLRELSPREAVEWARNFLGQVEMPELFHRFASTLAQGLGLTELELRKGVLERRGHVATAAPAQAPRQVTKDQVILTFAVRYPHFIHKLQEYSADLVLTAPWALKLWDKLQRYSADEVFSQLETQEKQFWMHCRDGEAAPLVHAEAEWLALRGWLEGLQLSSHSSSVKAALRQGSDLATQREYMLALSAQGRHNDQ